LIKSKFVFDLLVKLKHRRIITDYTLETNQIIKMEDLGMKKVILMLAIAALLVTVAGQAQAAKQWYQATITYAGALTQTGDNLYIYADSASDAWTGKKWFIVSGDQWKAHLAVALTAWSMEAPVLLQLEETDLDDWSPCYGIFIAPIGSDCSFCQ
jgi:hypothetical protein